MVSEGRLTCVTVLMRSRSVSFLSVTPKQERASCNELDRSNGSQSWALCGSMGTVTSGTRLSGSGLSSGKH